MSTLRYDLNAGKFLKWDRNRMTFFIATEDGTEIFHADNLDENILHVECYDDETIDILLESGSVTTLFPVDDTYILRDEEFPLNQEIDYSPEEIMSQTQGKMYNIFSETLSQAVRYNEDLEKKLTPFVDIILKNSGNIDVNSFYILARTILYKEELPNNPVDYLKNIRILKKLFQTRQTHNDDADGI